MKRTVSSESSGEGDEFFDAIDHIEEDSNDSSDNALAKKQGICRLQSLHESNLEEESHSSAEPPPIQRQEMEEEMWVSAKSFAITPKRQLETEELWVSAKSFINNSSEDSWDKAKAQSRSHSLLDSEPSESMGDEERETDVSKKIEHDTDTADNSGTESSPSSQSIETNENDNNGESTPSTKAIVPPINLESIRARTRHSSTPTNEIPQIFSVPTEELKQLVEKEYNEGDLQTLNRLVGKLQAAELSRPPIELDNNAKNEQEEKIDDAAHAETAVDDQEEAVGNACTELFFTPERVVDCSRVGDLVCSGAAVKSPLEALYLFCPEALGYNAKEGSQRGRRKIQPPSSPPTRTSISNEDDLVKEEVPPLSLQSESVESENDGHQQPGLDGDSSDDDSSITSVDKYQMINKDTGSIHDMRDVMEEINQTGSSDALDTRYSFLPTKDQLEYQRQSSMHADSNESEESATPVIPLAAASFDSAMTEESSAKMRPERKRGGVKFSTSKMAANVRKGVAGLKSSRQHKMNRKRTASADMIPGNAIHVRSSSRQKQNRSLSSGTSEHFQELQADSSFNPMLLVATLPNAHKGPAWCASFSQNGRFLATAGEDGNVCIWAVSPTSKVLHPDGVPTQIDDSSAETSDSEDSDTNESGAEDEDQKATAPPLHFIGTGPELASNLEILSSEPIQRFKDHTADVIDLSWSHTNFLLSASLDSTVRLYHYTKPGCLHLFKHANLVASVDFHPTDDRLFISGGIDKKLRLWDITDGRVKEWAQAPDVITTARFTPDGKYAVAGLFRGQVYFYDVNGLKYYTQIACRNRSGKHRMGKKVTGISFMRGERDDWLELKQKAAPEKKEKSPANEDRMSVAKSLSHTGKDIARRLSTALQNGSERPEALRYTERMLVSTNDSRVRLYGLNDFCLIRKYKGHSNYSMQIRARITESGSHIACGSESGHVFIWETLDKNRLKKSSVNMRIHATNDKTKSSDHFEASRAPLPIVTDTVFFPSKSVYEALLSSDKVFPFSLGMDRVDDDMSSAAILTLDYDGTIRVFLRKSCIDNILDAATPRGGHMT